MLWLRSTSLLVRFCDEILASSYQKWLMKIRPARKIFGGWLVFDSAQPPQKVARVAK
ncbi:uncharacterized protein DS421_14g475500 [Arachis hypogaea]|nr:uncharacterized protein DS421_14g475500 [Arachis hypogaea]